MNTKCALIQKLREMDFGYKAIVAKFSTYKDALGQNNVESSF